MKRLHFYQLPRHIQDRFVQASAGATVPHPIAMAPAALPVPWGWIGGALASFVVLILLLCWGYGDLHNALALSPPPLLAAYALCLGVTAYCSMLAVARWQQARRVPFQRGRYLFPGCLIDATRDEFEIIPTSDIESVEVVGDNGLRVRVAGGRTFDFVRRNSESAKRARERVISGRRELLEVDLKGDEAERARLNPLLEPRFSNPLGAQRSMLPPAPSFRKWLPLCAALLGAAIGLGLGSVRNRLSERRLFAEAVQQGTPEAYRAYLARGGVRKEVAEQLLPHAELEVLKVTGSLPELEKYAQQHAHTPIRPAIDQALRMALLQALHKAKQARTLSALDEFTRAHAFHALVESELQAARQELLASLADRFEREFAADTPELGNFMRSALQALASLGPEVQVRFLRIVPDSVERADKAVRKDIHFTGVMLPSQYFDAERSKSREAQLFAALEQRFSRAFPPDALQLKHGPSFEANAELPTQVQRPTLIITHSTNMGSGIGNLNPSGTFVGVGFLFKAYFMSPKWAPPLEIKFSTWKPPDLLKLRKGLLTIPNVYVSMADASFSAFEQRLTRWLFRE